MKKLLLLLFLPLFAFGQIPAVNDTIPPAGQGAAFTPSMTYGFLNGDFISYIKRGTSAKKDFYPTSAYMRKYFPTKLQLQLAKDSLVNLYTDQTIGGNKTFLKGIQVNGQSEFKSNYTSFVDNLNRPMFDISNGNGVNVYDWGLSLYDGTKRTVVKQEDSTLSFIAPDLSKRIMVDAKNGTIKRNSDGRFVLWDGQAGKDTSISNNFFKKNNNLSDVTNRDTARKNLRVDRNASNLTNRVRVNTSQTGESYGDSYTFGTGTSFAAAKYVNIFYNTLGLTFTNYAPNGQGMVYNQYLFFKNSPTVNNSRVTTLMIGFNDIGQAWGADPRVVTKLTNGYRSFIANKFLKTAVPGNDASITYSSAATTFRADSLAGKAVSLSGLGKSMLTAGSTVQWTFIGNNVVIGTIGTDGNYMQVDSLNVSIDGFDFGWYNFNNTMNTNLTNGSGISGHAQSAVVVIKNLGPASHTLTITKGGSSTKPMMIDYLGLMDNPTNCSPLVIGQIAHMTDYAIAHYELNGSHYTNASIDTANDYISSVIREFQGYPIGVAQTNDFFSPVRNEMYLDSIHPNNLGHSLIAQAFLAQVQNTSTPFASLTNTPTTLAGYSISDAYTKTASDAKYGILANSQIWGNTNTYPKILYNVTASGFETGSLPSMYGFTATTIGGYTFVSGDLGVQSRGNANRKIYFVTGSTPAVRGYFDENGLDVPNLTALKPVFTTSDSHLTTTGPGTSSQLIDGTGALVSTLPAATTATTQATTDNSTKIATTAFVQSTVGTNTLTSAATLTLTGTGWYTFNGTNTTWTLPAIAGNTNVTYYIKNRGTGNIVINSNAGGNDIYLTSATNTLTVVAGDAVILHNDSGAWSVE